MLAILALDQALLTDFGQPTRVQEGGEWHFTGASLYYPDAIVTTKTRETCFTLYGMTGRDERSPIYADASVYVEIINHILSKYKRAYRIVSIDHRNPEEVAGRQWHDGLRREVWVYLEVESAQQIRKRLPPKQS